MFSRKRSFQPRHVLTEMHLAWQVTSPASHALRQASEEACAASVEAAVAAAEEVVSWALANMATAPATMMFVKRILDVVEE